MRLWWLCQQMVMNSQRIGTRRSPQDLRVLGGCLLAGTADDQPGLATGHDAAVTLLMW